MDPSLQLSGNARARRASRLGTWLALAAFLLSWAAPQWHFAESVHNWCATHQALEHASAEHPSTQHGSVAHDAAAHGAAAHHAHAEPIGSDATAPRAVGTAEGPDEHSAACALAFAERPTTRAAVDAPDASTLTPSITRPLSAERTAPARRVALLREAPKTSPPALS